MFDAFRGADLLGVAGYRTQVGPKREHKGFLWGMYVLSAARGAGVGKMLVEAVPTHTRGRAFSVWRSFSLRRAHSRQKMGLAIISHRIVITEMSNRERQEDPSKATLPEASWHSARLRMARMTAPHGCDALVDHIILYRASPRSWTKEAVAIGRMLEHEQVDENQTAWRLAEVMSVDLLPEDLDGAEIYSEPVDLDEANPIPYNTVFDPERSAPIKRRMMTIQPGSTADATPWFSVKIRLACMSEGIGTYRFEDNVYLLRATDFDTAFQRALTIGRSKEREEFVNMNNQRARWPLVGVLSLNLLGKGILFDGVDVYSEAVTLRDEDRVPFDTVFHPENSNPAMTIG